MNHFKLFAILLLPGMAIAGTLSTPSADLHAAAMQLPKHAAQYAGEPFSLALVAATREAPLSYQWKKDGREVLGATSATLHFPASLRHSAKAVRDGDAGGGAEARRGVHLEMSRRTCSKSTHWSLLKRKPDLIS